MKTNEKLKELYQKHWDKTRDEIVIKKNSAFPFMIYANERFENAKRRVMFCGQETQSWNVEEYKTVESSTVDSIMKRYNAFVNNGGYNSPYWNFQNRIMNSNPDVGFVQNNIVKIGKRDDSGCDDDIDNLAHKYFPVFKDELNILKPHLIIFLTGPNYDDKIKNNLGSFVKENCLDEEEFSFLNHPKNICFDRLIFPDKNIPPAYRINHPRAIQQQNQYYPMIRAINLIVKRI